MIGAVEFSQPQENLTVMHAAGELVIDDRLATVLATPTSSAGGQRIQYRQLLDLLGRMSPDFALPAAALARLAELSRALPVATRTEILRSAPSSLRHPGLILRLASQEASVAEAAIAAARLDDWQWSALIAELPLAARGHVRQRRDLGPRATAMLARFGIGDLRLPSPVGEADVYDLTDLAPLDSLSPADQAPGDNAPNDNSEPSNGIAAIVRRIEAFRRNRQAGTRQFGDGGIEGSGDPRLPLSDPDRATLTAPATTIRFATDARGRISWADEGFAAAMSGLPFGAADRLSPARCDTASARAIQQRRPLRKGRLEIDGAPQVAGVWRIDAAPQFDPAGGRFTGYRGVLRRPSVVDVEVDDAADRLRQLLHELRTPINAIQGFAELIQQQVFGPTPHQYRSLAAGIAGDSAAILAGFEEIDLLVRLETSNSEDTRQTAELAGTADLAALVRRMIDRVAPSLAAREIRFELDSGGPASVALTESAAERPVWRLLAAISAAAAPGERLALELAASGDWVELWLALPAALVAEDTAGLFKLTPAGSGSPASLGLLGGGFAFRLARAEARAYGGGLDLDHGRFRLRLPGIIPAAARPGVEASRADLTPFPDSHSALNAANVASSRNGR